MASALHVPTPGIDHAAAVGVHSAAVESKHSSLVKGGINSNNITPFVHLVPYSPPLTLVYQHIACLFMPLLLFLIFKPPTGGLIVIIIINVYFHPNQYNQAIAFMEND